MGVDYDQHIKFKNDGHTIMSKICLSKEMTCFRLKTIFITVFDENNIL